MTKSKFDLPLPLLLSCGFGVLLTLSLVSVFGSNPDEQVLRLQSQVEDLESQLAEAKKRGEGSSFYEMRSASKSGADSKKSSDDLAIAACVKQKVVKIDPESFNAILNDVAGLISVSDEDGISFANKIMDYLHNEDTQKGAAVVSKSIYDMATNSDVLPNEQILSLHGRVLNKDVRRTLAQVLSVRGDSVLVEREVASYQQLLSSGDADVRQQALVDLGKFHHVSAVNYILPMLKDENVGVKLDALLALRASGNYTHIESLKHLVDDSDPSVSWLANDVIDHLQGLSEFARTKVVANDIARELPQIF